MKNIITISREYGSGGRLVGRQVADALDIPFYDKELIALVAKESGYDLKFVEETGEYSASSNILFNLATGSMANYIAYSETPMSMADQLHILQSKIIREIADTGPCVIVGRAADYILREREDCLNVFVCADIESKTKRAVEYFEIAPEKAEKALKKKDKARAQHYNHYTSQPWGVPSTYHVCVNSGTLGIEGAVKIIVDAVKTDNAK